MESPIPSLLLFGPSEWFRTTDALGFNEALCHLSYRRLVPTAGIEPARSFDHGGLSPARLPIPSCRLGTPSRPRTEKPRILSPRGLPIPIKGALCLDPRARFELAISGLGIHGPFHRPRVGPRQRVERCTLRLEVYAAHPVRGRKKTTFR